MVGRGGFGPAAPIIVLTQIIHLAVRRNSSWKNEKYIIIHGGMWLGEMKRLEIVGRCVFIIICTLGPRWAAVPKSAGLGGRGREPSLQHKRKKGQNQVKSSTDD